MLVPTEFARLAVVHGTVATISDPHEIGNVLGVEGVEYMIDNGKQVNFKFYFGAPSCVPATPFETAGAEIDVEDIEYLMGKDEILYLAEMMNWPGVLKGDHEVYAKIELARKFGKPVDGHAPGLRGKKAKTYIMAGIHTDHECFTKEEALDKLNNGMKIIIREGSAAKNFDALIDLLHDHEDKIMFCSDDKHPDNLVEGHINELAGRAVEYGVDVFKVLKAACLNPIKHYHLRVGTLKQGDPADFVMLDDLKKFKVRETYINGKLMAKKGKSRIKTQHNSRPNKFNTGKKMPVDFSLKSESPKVRVIKAFDGQLITKSGKGKVTLENGYAVSNPEKDILKLAVVNRYLDRDPALAFIKNFGLKRGAIASSVGHDSHNITVVGVDEESISRAVNLIIEEKGGISLIDGEKEMILPLPVAGLMSDADGYEVARRYSEIDAAAKELGSTLTSPFMTLSFMALLVIPDLKLSDMGLFDGKKFQFVEVFL
jgi:adenine deaminase